MLLRFEQWLLIDHGVLKRYGLYIAVLVILLVFAGCSFPSPETDTPTPSPFHQFEEQPTATYPVEPTPTPQTLPPITATKSLVGHGLGAAGGIESVASVLMVREGFVHPCLNCEDVHPEILPFAASIPHACRELPALRTMIKAGFGFGDVNACVVFSKWIH